MDSYVLGEALGFVLLDHRSPCFLSISLVGLYAKGIKSQLYTSIQAVYKYYSYACTYWVEILIAGSSISNCPIPSQIQYKSTYVDNPLPTSLV